MKEPVIFAPSVILKTALVFERWALEQPSLIVYFVAPGSKASKIQKTRMDLPEGTTPIVGLALRFPETEGPLSDVRAAGDSTRIER